MGNFKIAVVGTGWVSGEYMDACIKNPLTELSAVCSRTEDSASRKIGEYGINANIHTDFEEMLKKEPIDIVAVCTPNHLHASEAVLAAEYGKHVIIEKPVALSEKDLDRILEAVRKTGVKTLVSFVLHWNPLLMMIDRMLKDDAIGDIYYAAVDYYHGIGPWYKQYSWNVKKDIGGSSLLSAGCHAVDALLWFMKKKPVEVFSYGTRSKSPDFKDYEYDPTSVTLVKFEDGTVGKITSSIDCKTPYIFNTELYGSRGTIRNNRLFSHKLEGQTDYAEIPTILPDSGDVRHHPFQGELDHLVSCISENRRPFPDMENAAVTHRVIFAADRSAEEGKPVKLDT